MRLVQWIQHEIKKNASSLKVGGVLRERDEERVRFVQTQRELAKAWEKREGSLQKKLAGIVARIRNWQGSLEEVTFLEAEQRQMRRLLERLEVSDMDTVELLREWRDWMRAFRQGLGHDVERVELVGSELRLRGVIEQEAHIPLPTEQGPRGGEERHDAQDSFSEWDQYLGERLPATSAFWERRAAEVEADGAHPKVVHGFVKQMKQAQGQANTWRRMQRG